MFETSVVRSGAMRPRQHYRFLTLSLAVHSCAIAAVIATTLVSTRLPTEAPRQMELPPIIPVVPLTPALGKPDAPIAPVKRGTPPPAVKAQVTAPPASAPEVIPEATPVSTADTSTVTSTATSTSTEIGDPNSTSTVGSATTRGVPNGDPNSTSTELSAPLRAGEGGVKAPIVLHRVLPDYPRVAVMGKINGWVIVECIIDKTGRVQNARLVRSSFAAFEQPALDAIQKWIFSPGTLRGEPVDTIFELTVTFQVH